MTYYGRSQPLMEEAGLQWEKTTFVERRQPTNFTGRLLLIEDDLDERQPLMEDLL